MSLNKFTLLFGGIRSAIIGMVHLRALPGSPRARLSVEEITRIACQEANMYKEANVDGVLIENMHDLPWHKQDQIEPETVASMAVVCAEVRRCLPNLPLGIQVLSAGNKQALAIAKAAGLDFVRAEGYVFGHVGDEGPMFSCAADLTRYRKAIGADRIQIFTDIKKKHCSHAITSDVSITDTALAAELFMSDGLIVTGTSTGVAANLEDIKDVQRAVQLPVLVGSGVTEHNVGDYLSANAIIIGSHVKRHGLWYNGLDAERLALFMGTVERLRHERRSQLDAADRDEGDKTPWFQSLDTHGE